MASSRKTPTLCERDTRQLRGTNLIHPLARDVKDTLLTPIKNTHLRHVTVHYFSRIVQPEAVFFPYWTSKTGFFRIVHYIREVTRWFLSSASKLFSIVIYNQINLFDI
jgi:hypothetical protein